MTEEDRLLYVAVTRARNMLLVNGRVELRSNKPSAKGWLQKLVAACDAEDVLLLSASPKDGLGQYSPQTFTVQNQELLVTVYPPTHRFAPTLISHSTNDVDITPNPSLFVSLLPDELLPPPPIVLHASDSHVTTYVDTLVHDALGQWQLPNRADFITWLDAQCFTQDIPLFIRETIPERVTLLLKRFLAHPIYHEIESTEICLREVAYGWGDDFGRIDLLYKSAEQWIVLDYKTNHISGDDMIESVIATYEYNQQLQHYMAVVSEKVGVPVIGRICFLDDHGKITIWSP